MMKTGGSQSVFYYTPEEASKKLENKLSPSQIRQLVKLKYISYVVNEDTSHAGTEYIDEIMFTRITQLMTAQDVGLVFNCSAGAIRDYTRARLIAVLQLGRMYFYDPAEVNKKFEFCSNYEGSIRNALTAACEVFKEQANKVAAKPVHVQRVIQFKEPEPEQETVDQEKEEGKSYYQIITERDQLLRDIYNMIRVGLELNEQRHPELKLAEISLDGARRFDG